MSLYSPAGQHDESGLVWPREISPADVHIVATGKDEAVFVEAETLARSLAAEGLPVVYDDRRGVSPGVKFNDSELIGVPTIVVGRGPSTGTLEVKDRRPGVRARSPSPTPLPRYAARSAAGRAPDRAGSRAPAAPRRRSHQAPVERPVRSTNR